MTKPFKVLMTCGFFEPGYRAGGPIRSVGRIVDTIPEDIDLSVMTRDRDFGSSQPYPGLSGTWVKRGRADVFYLDVRSLSQWWQLLKKIRANPVDLLYVNSMWALTFSVIPVVAARLGLVRASKILMAPRGELSPGALSLKARKKQLFLKVWGTLLRSMAVTWHATAELEAKEIRAVFPWAKVHIVSNQTALPDEPFTPTV
ncbi:MAG TPA: hypothetical protein VFO77_15630, partial [Actinoplanes sp.]|nr:hypothetical protein [Actinoplanes sp.]